MIQSCIIIVTQRLLFPLFLHKNSLRTRANLIVHHVSPVMEDDMLVRPFRLLDRRLSWRYTSTAQSWTSGHVLRNARNELMKERKSQAAIESERETGPEGRRRDAAIPISHMNRRSQRRKFTSSLICHHSHGAKRVSEEEVRRTSRPLESSPV